MYSVTLRTKSRVDQHRLAARGARHLCNVCKLELALLRGVDGAEHIPLFLVTQHANDVLRALDLRNSEKRVNVASAPGASSSSRLPRTNDSGRERWSFNVMETWPLFTSIVLLGSPSSRTSGVTTEYPSTDSLVRGPSKTSLA